MVEKDGVAFVRKELALLPLVSRTWFEWEMEDGVFTRVLVIEVTCDTDPNSSACDVHGLQELGHAVKRILIEQTMMVVGNLRLVPKNPPQFTLPKIAMP
ncbi:hypothetical protein HN018_19550 [Lichenicola cladoniae]|uniref:Uncharacterized protein n=1 Tax=Lichenicola cladoniae TaxID=1484109 RepID=A0A6M8HTT3_9PROT|nr:hypothetical protein [Lichenicola cladoniae]NPD66057.1 hypothetical protein [Acetobacteraceae bacterium]QKE91934.1 hypothetical protein HN018_19550 [Lichenicola cladoniae]